MSLLRGMAAVIPPLLSRASPSSVAKHIAAFISTLPLRALNPAAMETAAALLSNIFEHGRASARAPGNTSPTSFSYANSPVTDTGLRIAAAELLAPTIALLHRLAEAALSQREAVAAPGGAAAVATAHVYRAHGRAYQYCSRARSIWPSQLRWLRKTSERRGGTLPPKKRPTLAPCLYS